MIIMPHRANRTFQSRVQEVDRNTTFAQARHINTLGAGNGGTPTLGSCCKHAAGRSSRRAARNTSRSTTRHTARTRPLRSARKLYRDRCLPRIRRRARTLPQRTRHSGRNMLVPVVSVPPKKLLPHGQWMWRWDVRQIWRARKCVQSQNRNSQRKSEPHAPVLLHDPQDDLVHPAAWSQ